MGIRARAILAGLIAENCPFLLQGRTVVAPPGPYQLSERLRVLCPPRD